MINFFVIFLIVNQNPGVELVEDFESSISCQSKNGFVTCKQKWIGNEVSTKIFETVNRKTIHKQTYQKNISCIEKIENGFICGSAKGEILILNEKFDLAKETKLKDKEIVKSITEVKTGYYLMLLGSNKIFAYDSKNNIVELYYDNDVYKDSIKLMCAKKQELIHIVGASTITCLDFKTKKRIYTLINNGKLEDFLINKHFVYSKNGERFTVAFDSFNLKKFETLEIPKVVNTYDSISGKVVRMQSIDVEGSIISLMPINEIKTAFIAKNKNKTEYGLFEIKKSIFGTFDTDGGEPNIIGKISDEGSLSRRPFSEIYNSEDGSLVFRIGRFLYQQ